MKSVLFVGGGRRVVLARLFIERGWTVYAYETSKDVPIAHIAKEVVVGKKWGDEDIVEHLHETAIWHRCELVVPLMDAAIPVCARLNTGITVLATSENAICSDKKAFEEQVLDVAPGLYPVVQQGKMAILKPIQGFGSHGIEETYISEWRPFWRFTGKVAQRKLMGPEYTVDAYFSPDGEYVDSVPRLRRIVADGEVKSSITQDMPGLQLATKLIGEHIGLSGPVNMQFIIEDGDPYVTECNARFGGGWSLSIAAGLDAIRLIERDYFGEDFEYVPNQWTRNLATERYFEEFFYHEDNHR